jgi:hypothetical protein
VYCVHAAHALPQNFPVASHAGAATIAATIVDRRPDVWPDDERVDDGPATIPATSEVP